MRWLIILLIFISCQKEKEISKPAKKEVVILVQALGEVPSSDVDFVTEKIKNYYPNVKILEKIKLPKEAYYKERNRYRADSLIKYLSERTADNFVTLGLTNKDISATKGKITDFGIFGLAYRPGKSAIASSFRTKKESRQEEFFKVAIHELGHTQGLKHCPNPNCLMKSAEGKSFGKEVVDFCDKCKSFLKTKDWKF
ncbi:matrixin family metalloprotease [Soonwooa sp.]|uniref:matrixin family metalloprotease n=1 Tax=Soonwooa sp. TaxID=1938592 RepID=UPI00260DA5F0|nr:matrixin family metalloprotease [Soonwooa sp.]